MFISSVPENKQDKTISHKLQLPISLLRQFEMDFCHIGAGTGSIFHLEYNIYDGTFSNKTAYRNPFMVPIPQPSSSPCLQGL